MIFGGMLAVCSLFCGADPVEDFARADGRAAWTHHVVCGDPSWDTFQRLPGNPIHRGAPPFEWPVNGFFFEDPPTGDWLVYVGRYPKNYAMIDGLHTDCVVYRSQDHGAHWTFLGNIFPDSPFQFDADTAPIGPAPDVSVVYADGRYHLIYDWATENTTWETAARPAGTADNGIGYAWADRPQGPFTRTTPAVYRTGKSPLRLGKYQRGYAASLLRREKDWLVLFMMDSGPNFSWALFGVTAEKPEGPYSEPVLLRAVDGEYYHPPLLEYFPAFQYAGRVYAPATSVALNRNYQGLFRAPLAEAMRPEAWELAQAGSVWHADPKESEAYGIWGQTFSGFVDKEGMFRVMFPSRDTQGFGTIHLAARPWEKPCRESGFVLSGHQGPAITLLQRAYTGFSLDMTVDGLGENAILWDDTAPIGPDRTTADATLHPLMKTRQAGLFFTDIAWRMVDTEDSGAESVTASGKITTPIRRIALTRTTDGKGTLLLNDSPAWEGRLPVRKGMIGLYAAAHSRMEVTRFQVTGAAEAGQGFYLAAEAILGAGAADHYWEKVTENPNFRYGEGALSIRPGARAKWNVTGAEFALWAPTGPTYGAGEIRIDGVSAGRIDFHRPEAGESRILWRSESLTLGNHAVVLIAGETPIPLDSLEVMVPVVALGSE